MKQALFFLLALALLGGGPARAALPDGLYTTQAANRNGATPVGLNGFYRSGFTLLVPGGWRLADPILPLDFKWLKPWIEGPGVIVRIRGVAGRDPADAARRAAPPRAGQAFLGSAPFPGAGGLAGVRALYGSGRDVVSAVYFFANRSGEVLAFTAEPWPRGTARLGRVGKPLPGDALMRTLGLERQDSGRPPR